MTQQEFDSHKWGKNTEILFSNYLPKALQRSEKVLAVNFETQWVQIKSLITRRPVWVFCGDFELKTK